MADILIDSNIILDVLTEDPQWLEWSAEKLAELAKTDSLVINPIIYAEISIGFQKIEDLEAVLPEDVFRRDPLPYEAAFLAGKRFLEYRRKGGSKTSTLPDFYIGSHAVIQNMRLLTRDSNRYQTYFPQLVLITPKSV